MYIKLKRNGTRNYLSVSVERCVLEGAAGRGGGVRGEGGKGRER